MVVPWDEGPAPLYPVYHLLLDGGTEPIYCRGDLLAPIPSLLAPCPQG